MSAQPATRLEVRRRPLWPARRWFSHHTARLVAVVDERGLTFSARPTLLWRDMREVRWITALPGRGFEHLDPQQYLAFIPAQGCRVRTVGVSGSLLARRWGTPLVLVEGLIVPSLQEVVETIRLVCGVPIVKLQDPPGRGDGPAPGADESSR